MIEKIPDADVVIAYGGMAAKLFYQQDSYPVPVIADAITDALAAGVTETVTDSGKDFFSVKIDPELFRQQVRLFHELTGFKKLGIVYGDDEFGVIYGAVRDVEAVAEELGFEIIRNTNVKEDMDDDTVDMYLDALRDVVSRADAVYIGASTAVTEYDIIPEIVHIINEAKIPSFALEGSVRVKDGILFSLASSGMIRSGIYTATKITHIFEGIKPRELPQIFESIPSVAINLATAKTIGFNVPVDIIINSDEVYLSADGSAPVSRHTDNELLSGFTNYAATAIQLSDSYLPRRRADGKPFRIAILQSGTYWEFDEHFRGILSGLIANGWANFDTVIPEKQTIREMVKSIGDFSEYIEFPEEYILDLEWGQNTKAAGAFFTDRKPDVDLVIAFGGVAGKLFTRYKNYPIPVLMEGITDPVGSGIIYSLDDSGRDFVTCRVDPGQYQRQVQLFHDFAGFKRLGILYGDDEYGRLYGAVNDVELVARKKGFTLVRNTNVKEVMAPDTTRLYLSALRDLCTRVDAVYLGASTAITEYDIMDEVVAILNKARIPSFALEGEIRVDQGIMLGISSLETEKFGFYNARKIAAILSGVTPRILSQRLEGVPSIILNLDTAQEIGFSVPLSILSSVDQLVYAGSDSIQ
ncbi:hypothetical protein K7I13_14945 [Brucepastera parasyntrophica]|uniref:ABC transporter substrate-binding protein n=1 Tax=Brucepastera parasyntrophica TaxID=2880008 RepID=UPI0021087ACC|nr:ABC transporter substrate binding protein [Brucepastera parasyntrophica]ULQ59728.1 hypothetical protein K7I13_14945 [Brucepastera parasyntrophica]